MQIAPSFVSKYLYLILLLLLSLGASATQAPGYIVKTDGDTIWVQVEMKANKRKAWFKRSGEAVIYYDQQGAKQLLQPSEARIVGFVWNSDTVRLYSFINEVGIQPSSLIDDDYEFFLLVEKGKVNLFSYEESRMVSPGNGFTGGGPVINNITTYFLQYDNQPHLVRVKPHTFRRDMTDYFREHEQLAGLIDSWTYTLQDMSKIVREYNKFRAKDTYETPAEPADGF